MATLLTACGSSHPAPSASPTAPTSSAPATSPAPTVRGLSEDSTCADYLRASQDDQYAWLTDVVHRHYPAQATGPSASGFEVDVKVSMLADLLNSECPDQRGTQLSTILGFSGATSPSP
ncbi:hypothetical protein ACFP3V_23800 [Streptacidiphilus monticola]|uniref:DUF732 domain-containing protein n=1 Tax=Streptacidiphilus monticola TaxID=2161674 RepID=A0ABW1G9L5_9ACTN